ncbi:MAG: hypothetical protein HPY74_02460 [Firmicutes bacterium]|nr:hypothetical protein [Bacillota bacterium]
MYGIEDRTASSPTSSDNKGVMVITGQHMDHNFSSWTFYDSNTHRKSCSVCDGYVSSNHDYEWIIVYDTSGNDIGHVKDCVQCHDRKDSGFHVWSDWYNAGAIGEQRHCTVCQLSTETRPHDFDVYWLYGQPPTCLYEGIKVYDCKNCLYEYQEIVPALGHDWQWITYNSYKNSSTCPYRRYWEDERCTRCGIWHWVDRYYKVSENHSCAWF